MKLDSSALDQDGPLDKIDDDVGLRSSGQFDLFIEESDRFLERAGIIGIETREDIQLRGPAGHNEGQEEDLSGKKNVHAGCVPADAVRFISSLAATLLDGLFEHPAEDNIGDP